MIRRLLIVGALVLLGGCAGESSAPVDFVIRGGRIVDGTGNASWIGDVAVRGDRIVAIGEHLEVDALQEIDATGLVVAPGFIDVHTHARRGLFRLPTADNYVRQGVTTVMEGPDGSSPLPVAPFLARLDSLGPAINIGLFVGHGSIRAAVLGEEDRAPDAIEIDSMRALTEQAMLDGAFGLSTGLFYVPGNFADTGEVIELARVVAGFGGSHTSHMRDEASGLIESVEETIRIGEEGGLPTQLTHHKVIGQANWGASRETLRQVDEARARGVDVTIDQYPYAASSTSIEAALLPQWAREGGRTALLTRLSNPETRASIKAETERIIREERGGGDLSRVQLASCGWDSSLDGKHLGDVTARLGLAPSIPNGAEAVFWLVGQGGCSGIFHAIGEGDLDAIMRHPQSMVASDGGVIVFGEAMPHPRSYGTFARVLGHYVRDQGVLTLEEAVRKMSGFPAARLGLTDRGILAEGTHADIVLFHPETVTDMATFEQPHQYAEGFAGVWVNGQQVFDGATMTGARPGAVLYGPGKRP
ncbi:MAG: D-aminoacylase [Bacteroidetes bacterium]|nr:D-aminoacylase [Bacteroidota bacterium]